MKKIILSVRELRENDLDSIVHYWLNSDDTFLRGMGVDLNKIPPGEELRKMLIYLCTVKKYADTSFSLLAEQLLKSPPNQLPAYAEKAMPVIGDKKKNICQNTYFAIRGY